MNSSGTSLIAAAIPTPAPLNQRRSGWHMSHTMSTMSSSSTWPRCSARCTGSIQNAAPATSRVQPSRSARRPPTPSSRNAIHTVVSSASVLATAATSSSTRHGRNDSTANTIAANGV